MIAKALVQECPLIILDEPTAFLDVVSRIEIMTLLHQLAVEQNKAILLSTHDIEQALVLSDKLWLLSKENRTAMRSDGRYDSEPSDGQRCSHTVISGSIMIMASTIQP